jgi:hypothetical protein
VTNTFAVLRLLPVGDRDKDTEILMLRHQIEVLERQLTGRRSSFTSSDETGSAAYSTSTNLPHGLHARNNQHPQACRWRVRSGSERDDRLGRIDKIVTFEHRRAPTA